MAILCAGNVFAQMEPIYFDDEGVVNSPKKATAYGVFGKLSNEVLWVLKKFDFDDNLIVTGSYKDELLSTPHGKFVFYNSILEFNYLNNTSYNNRKIDRYVSQRGAFIDGLSEGTWYDYFPDGTVMHYQNYKNGNLDGPFRTFDKKGRVEFMGQYREGERVGTWYDIVKRKKATFENNKLISKERLKREELLSIK